MTADLLIAHIYVFVLEGRRILMKMSKHVLIVNEHNGQVVSTWHHMPWFHFTKGLEYNIRLQKHEANMAQDEPLSPHFDRDISHMFVMESCTGICYP